MTLLHPERFGAELRRGSQFEIREGSRVVGKGMIEVVKGQEVAPRPGITDRRAQLLNLIREGGGLSRKEILERMGLKGDKSGEKSISRVLTALTRDDRIRRKEGKYYPVGNTGATNDPISSHL